jgi:hypothetical protein
VFTYNRKETITRLFVQAQLLFRIRLIRLKEELHAKRLAEHAIMREAWLRDLRKQQAWADHCRERACPDCGGDLIYGSAQTPCRCASRATVKSLKKMLRQLVGLNGKRGIGRRGVLAGPEWADWNYGRPGPHLCGPGTWDNVVRALEDLEE